MPTLQTSPTQPKESCTITIRDVYGKDLKDIVIPAGYEYAGFELCGPSQTILTVSEAPYHYASNVEGKSPRIKLRKLPPPPAPLEYDYLFVRRDTHINLGEYYLIGVPVMLRLAYYSHDIDHKVAIYRQVSTDNRI